MQVLGTGTTPGGRSIAWVAPDVDTVSMFTQALAGTYGKDIAIAVARELGLEPSPGKPLSLRTIEMALDMAQMTRHALEGVDFGTRLDCSATAGGPGFIGACRDLGIAPESVDPAQRQRIDESMAQRFDQAAAQGQTPVSSHTAQEWLRELLTT